MSVLAHAVQEGVKGSCAPKSSDAVQDVYFLSQGLDLSPSSISNPASSYWAPLRAIAYSSSDLVPATHMIDLS